MTVKDYLFIILCVYIHCNLDQFFQGDPPFTPIFHLKPTQTSNYYFGPG